LPAPAPFAAKQPQKKPIPNEVIAIVAVVAVAVLLSVFVFLAFYNTMSFNQTNVSNQTDVNKLSFNFQEGSSQANTVTQDLNAKTATTNPASIFQLTSCQPPST